MKKFKIKNKPKRKYVKKNDLAASYASAQSLTVGLVPLILMATAFFITILMTNPRSLTISISMPAIHVTLPKIPEIAFPSYEPPKISLPDISIPNPIPFLVSLSQSIWESFSGWMSALIESVYEFCMTASRTISNVLSRLGGACARLTEQVVTALVQGFSATREFISTAFQALGSASLRVAVAIADAIQYAFTVTVNALTQSIMATTAWLKATISATISAWNAFVWFLGTPFRALHEYSVALGIQLAPYLNFLSVSLQQATSDLRQGGQNLAAGTQYVTTTIEHNQQTK